MRAAIGRNTPEYRGRITEAARAAIPTILEAAGGTLSTQEIHQGVQRRAPDICDDSISCHAKGHDHTEWDHQVDLARQHLKHRGAVRNAGRGLWRLSGFP